MTQKTRTSLIVAGITVLAGLLILLTVLNRSQQDPNLPDQVTDFDSCVAKGGNILESYPRQCSYDGTTYPEEISVDGGGPDMSLPTGEKAAIETWIEENNLNEYGDSSDTVYAGGTPLFDEAEGKYISLYTYLIRNHPEKPWEPTEDSPTSSDNTEESDTETPISFTEVREWKTFQEPNFEMEYPSFVVAATENGYPIRFYTNNGFEMYLTVSTEAPQFANTTCTEILPIGTDQAAYLCDNNSVRYSQIYQRVQDSVVAR